MADDHGKTKDELPRRPPVPHAGRSPAAAEGPCRPPSRDEGAWLVNPADYERMLRKLRETNHRSEHPTR